MIVTYRQPVVIGLAYRGPDETLVEAHQNPLTIAAAIGPFMTADSITEVIGTAGSLLVRYDALQPTVDCLWCAPDGRVVLITGS